MAKLSKSVRDTIMRAFYGAGYAMQVWAGERAQFKHQTVPGCTMTNYHYRNHFLDLVRMAEVREGTSVQKPGRKLYPVSLSQMQAAMATSILHKQFLRAGDCTISVRQLEATIVEKFKDIEQYIEVFLGEHEDDIVYIRTREVVIRIKPEFTDQINFSFKHKLADIDLRETRQSSQARAEREIFSS